MATIKMKSSFANGFKGGKIMRCYDCKKPFLHYLEDGVYEKFIKYAGKLFCSNKCLDKYLEEEREKEGKMNEREIKFRLRIGNRIVGYERIKPDEDGYLISTYSFDNSIGGWFFEPEPFKHKNKDEFVSLKDKNGKEIYEGDLVRFKRPFWNSDGDCEKKEVIEKVGFYNGSFTANNFEEDCFYISWDEMKVIGNIYENPELLKEEK